MKTAIVRAFALMSVGICAWCAGPQLTPQQIQAAIARGKQDNNTAEMLLACLDPKYSSSAHVQWRHLCDVIPTGRPVTDRGAAHKVGKREKRQFSVSQPHLVLEIGDRIVQPTDKAIKSSGYNFASELEAMAVGPSQSAVSVVEFAFDVSPRVLQCPAELILIDENGKKHQREVNPAGVLDINWQAKTISLWRHNGSPALRLPGGLASQRQRLPSSPAEIC